MPTTEPSSEPAEGLPDRDQNSGTVHGLPLDVLRDVFAASAEDHSEHLERGLRLGDALWACFQQDPSHTTLQEYIDVQKRLIVVHPKEMTDRGQTLASTLDTFFDLTGDDRVLDESIAVDRLILAGLTPGAPDRWRSLGNLAAHLKKRFERTGDASFLLESIELQREGVATADLSDMESLSMKLNLAVILKTHFVHTRDELSLDECIEIQRQALQSVSTDHPYYVTLLINNVGTLMTRCERTGDVRLLDQAEQTLQLNLNTLKLSTDDQAALSGTLAGALKLRFDMTVNHSLLRKVIELERWILQVQVHDRARSRARACANLASTLQRLWRIEKNNALLVEAAVLQQEAIELEPAGTKRALLSASLAETIFKQFAESNDPALGDQARSLLISALNDLPSGHLSRWRVLVPLCRVSLTLDFVKALTWLFEALSTDSDDPAALLRAAVQLLATLSDVEMSGGQKNMLLFLFSISLDLCHLLAGFLLDHHTQMRHWVQLQILAPSAYKLASDVRDLDAGLQLLERARGIVWSQALQIRTWHLEGAPPRLAAELDVLLRKLGSGSEPGPADHRQDTSQLTQREYGRVHELLREIRSLPNLQNFMRGPTHETLKAASAAHPIVILAVAGEECRALIIKSPHEPLASLVLKEMSASALQELKLGSHYSRGDGPEAEVTDDHRGMNISGRARPSASHKLLAKLWHSVVKPVLNHLGIERSIGVRPRLHWCPTGAFIFAPIHAAGVYDGSQQECCADYVVSSYTPTVAALLRAQQNAQAYTVPQLLVSLLAVARAQDAKLPTLHSVHAELDNVAEVCRKMSVAHQVRRNQESTTTMEVMLCLESANIVHIACHGVQHATDPLSSAFCLSDGSLTVSQLMKLDLTNAFFAFLGACETAKGDKQQPDQAIHLAATMLFIGFKSIVATMWAMRDEDGPRVAKMFYQKVLENKTVDADAVAFALDYAVSELRKNGVPPERWATFIHIGA